MKSRVHGRAGATGLVAVGLTAAMLVAAGDARAHGDTDVERPTIEGPARPPGAPAPAGEVGVAPGEAAGEAHEERYMLGLDLTLGWGKVPFAFQNLPAVGNPTVTYSRVDQTESNVQSFIIEGSAEVAEHVGVGLRVPFTFAGFSPNGSAARATTSFGNVELEGEYSVMVARGLRVFGALGVALPTAQGREVPAGLSNQSAAFADQSAYDRWSLSRAAAFARGYEDNALFEPDRLGLIPKIGVTYRTHGLSIEPYVKVENLIGTSTLLEKSYVGELVGALRVGYWVHKQFEVAVKGWVNVGYAGTDDDKTTAAALEPQLVLRFGHVRPYAGVIIPVAGPPSDNGFVGVRVGMVGSF